MASIDLYEQECVPALYAAAYRLLVQDRKDQLDPEYKSNAAMTNFDVALVLMRIAMLSTSGVNGDEKEIKILTRGY